VENIIYVAYNKIVILKYSEHTKVKGYCCPQSKLAPYISSKLIHEQRKKIIHQRAKQHGQNKKWFPPGIKKKGET